MRCGLLLFLIGCLTSPIPALAEQLVIGGSGADLATFRLLANAFQERHGDISITVKPSVGSSGGIRAVKKGLFDLGLTSRAPRDNERSKQLVFKHYARTPLVFAVSAESGVSEISARQVADIYSGQRSTWPDGTPARPVLRPSSDSDIQLLVSSLDGFQTALASAYMRKELPMAITDQEAAAKISSIKGAIGTSTLALIRTEEPDLKPLTLDGIDPTRPGHDVDAYPLYKDLYLVYQKNNNNRVLKAFIDFLDTPFALELLERTGHEPSR